MNQKRLFKIYCFLSALHFFIFFAGWGAGSHGHMLANKSEAIKIILILIMLALLPFLRYFEMKQKAPTFFLILFTLILMTIELVIISYYTFIFGSDINPLTFFMSAMIISIITQIMPIYRQLRFKLIQ